MLTFFATKNVKIHLPLCTGLAIKKSLKWQTSSDVLQKKFAHFFLIKESSRISSEIQLGSKSWMLEMKMKLVFNWWIDDWKEASTNKLIIHCWSQMKKSCLLCFDYSAILFLGHQDFSSAASHFSTCAKKASKACFDCFYAGAEEEAHFDLRSHVLATERKHSNESTWFCLASHHCVSPTRQLLTCAWLHNGYFWLLHEFH